jgi:hypothetical protein
MAKQKLKLKLDGSSSIDQAFDLPDFDFEVKPPKDDRKPATAPGNNEKLKEAMKILRNLLEE